MKTFFDDIRFAVETSAKATIFDECKKLGIECKLGDDAEHLNELTDCISELAYAMHEIIKDSFTSATFTTKRLIYRKTLKNFLHARSWVSIDDQVVEKIEDKFFDNGLEWIKATDETLTALAVQLYRDCCYKGGFQNQDPTEAIEEIIELLLDEVCETTITKGDK